ncbi:tol-pal system protein YbgF [Acidihalobacter prosperus]
MRLIRWISTIFLLVGVFYIPGSAVYAAKSQAVIQLYQQMNDLQQEVRQIRGRNQELQHEIHDLRKRQRQLYMNTDQRLQALEAAVSGGGTPASGQSNGVGPSMPASSTGQMPASSTSTPAPAASGNNASNSSGDNNGLDAYQQAFNLLKNSHYHEAVNAFKSFLKNYPKSRYVPNAIYWMGEALYVEQHFNQALAQFQRVVNHYPKSNKVAASMLKIGYSQYELKQWSDARKTLHNVENNYPGTNAARLAADRLNRMQREGH